MASPAEIRHADWYFDFISPFAYFAWKGLGALPKNVHVRPRPLVFAALLNHWGQKGPAEIDGKRVWTYRWCLWWAQRNGIAFQMPAAHPFNPLPYLRLALLADCRADAIDAIFDAIWNSGADAGDAQLPIQLAQKLGLDILGLQAAKIKQALHEHTDAAIALGVFGVPTLDLEGELFWGSDAMPMIQDYLANTALFGSPDMQRIDKLRVGVRRKIKSSQ